MKTKSLTNSRNTQASTASFRRHQLVIHKNVATNDDQEIAQNIYLQQPPEKHESALSPSWRELNLTLQRKKTIKQQQHPCQCHRKRRTESKQLQPETPSPPDNDAAQTPFWWIRTFKQITRHTLSCDGTRCWREPLVT